MIKRTRKSDRALDYLEERRYQMLGYGENPNKRDILFDRARETLDEELEEIRYHRLKTVDNY